MRVTGSRIASAALALLVQVALLALLIFSHGAQVARERFEGETIFLLPPLPQIVPAPAPPATGPSRPRQTAPPIAAPPSPVPPPANTAPAPSSAETLRSLGRSVFGCAMENWSNLTREQQSHCQRPGEGVAIQNAPDLMGTPSQAKDEAHWQAEWTREQSPVWVACTRTQGDAVMVDPLCLTAKILDGSIGDPKTWPLHAVNQLPKEDFYKLEQTYQQWHKDHPVNAAPAR
jgi:hypothetical protein